MTSIDDSFKEIGKEIQNRLEKLEVGLKELEKDTERQLSEIRRKTDALK